MAKRVSHPQSGTRSKGKPKTYSKKYAIDIIFPTGQRRCAGRFNRLSSARDRYNELIATCSIADRITATRLADGFTFGHRRGSIGYC
jgi:hypothetical protein